MVKNIISIVLGIVVALCITSTTASADIGPKPSVVIKFEGLRQENCYVTLLSKSDSTGPYSLYDGDSSYAHYNEDDEGFEIWKKFVSYQDKDGFYFLQYFSKPDDCATFKWGYHPPQEFKILMYFPDSDSFLVSDESYERYAFDSYFKVDATDLSSTANNGKISAVKSYEFTWELFSLITRIVITIALELTVALLFGFRAKKQILIIGITNVITQTVLNVLLNIINYSQGQMMFVLHYIWLEFFV
ncbi:MAG: hypothetical protein AAGU75_01070, partial [Bacillota bacterium]